MTTSKGHRWSDLGRHAARIRAATYVAAITGAGVSASCGIQTYRGPGGLYDDPATGDRTVAALSAETLALNPEETWRVVASLARLATSAQPGVAHEALVRIEQAVETFVLLSQNVDGLHEVAGSKNRIDVHGTVRRLRCMTCPAVRPLRGSDLEHDVSVPRCEDCDGVLRPDAVLFGEMLPTGAIERIQQELVEAPVDLMLVTGTTAQFAYILEPIRAAHDRGVLIVEFGPEPTAATPLATVSIRTGAEEGLTWIADCIGHRGQA